MSDTERLENIVDVIQWCQERDLPADVVGRWVWVQFGEKPSEDTRAALKAVGFRWVPRRGEWAHNCGHPSRHGAAAPRWKYGAVPVGALSAADLAEVQS